MKIKLTSREYSERLARKRGIPIAPPDHPIYKEGPTFILLSDSPLSNEKGQVFKGGINEAKKSIPSSKLNITHGSSSGTKHLQVISKAEADKLGIPTHSEAIISQKLRKGSKTSHGQQ